MPDENRNDDKKKKKERDSARPWNKDDLDFDRSGKLVIKNRALVRALGGALVRDRGLIIQFTPEPYPVPPNIGCPPNMDCRCPLILCPVPNKNECPDMYCGDVVVTTLPPPPGDEGPVGQPPYGDETNPDPNPPDPRIA